MSKEQSIDENFSPSAVDISPKLDSSKATGVLVCIFKILDSTDVSTSIQLLILRILDLFEWSLLQVNLDANLKKLFILTIQKLGKTANTYQVLEACSILAGKLSNMNNVSSYHCKKLLQFLLFFTRLANSSKTSIAIPPALLKSLIALSLKYSKETRSVVIQAIYNLLSVKNDYNVIDLNLNSDTISFKSIGKIYEEVFEDNDLVLANEPIKIDDSHLQKNQEILSGWFVSMLLKAENEGIHFLQLLMIMNCYIGGKKFANDGTFIDDFLFSMISLQQNVISKMAKTEQTYPYILAVSLLICKRLAMTKESENSKLLHYFDSIQCTRNALLGQNNYKKLFVKQTMEKSLWKKLCDTPSCLISIEEVSKLVDMPSSKRLSELASDGLKTFDSASISSSRTRNDSGSGRSDNLQMDDQFYKDILNYIDTGRKPRRMSSSSNASCFESDNKSLNSICNGIVKEAENQLNELTVDQFLKSF